MKGGTLMAHKAQALRMLETYFGYPSFRPAQEAPVESLLNNEDVIAIMPTQHYANQD